MLRKSRAHSFQLFLQCVFSFFRNFSLFFFQRVFDLALCLGSNHKSQPVLRRFLLIACDDLDLVAAAQFLTDRYEFMIELSTDAFYSDRTMNRKCKVQRRRADW